MGRRTFTSIFARRCCTRGVSHRRERRGPSRRAPRGALRRVKQRRHTKNTKRNPQENWNGSWQSCGTTWRAMVHRRCARWNKRKRKKRLGPRSSSSPNNNPSHRPHHHNSNSNSNNMGRPCRPIRSSSIPTSRRHFG